MSRCVAYMYDDAARAFMRLLLSFPVLVCPFVLLVLVIFSGVSAGHDVLNVCVSAFAVSFRTSFARTQRRRQSWRVDASWRCRSPLRPARHHRHRAVREQVGCCRIRLLHCRIRLSRSRPLADSKQQPQPLPPAAVCQSQTRPGALEMTHGACAL